MHHGRIVALRLVWLAEQYAIDLHVSADGKLWQRRTYRFSKPLTVAEEECQAIAKMHEWDAFVHELAQPSNEALEVFHDSEYIREYWYQSESGAGYVVAEPESDADSFSSYSSGSDHWL